MRRLEIALVIVLPVLPLRAQTPPPGPPPAQNAGEQEKEKEKPSDVDRYVKEIKDLADHLRGQMKELAKTAVSQRRKLDQEIGKIQAEIDAVRAEYSKEQDGEDASEREVRRRYGMREEQTLARKVTEITNELRGVVTEANGKAQESLKSATYQYEKLLAKVRALDGTKVAEEAVKEFSHAIEEARRLIREVIAKDTGVSTPRAAARQGLPGAGGGAPGAVPAPSRVVARPDPFGRPGADAAPPAAAPREKAMEEMRRVEQLGRAGLAPPQAPAVTRTVPVAGAPTHDPEEVVKLRSEIKELRNEIKELRDVLQKLVTEKAKGTGGAEPANTPKESNGSRRVR